MAEVRAMTYRDIAASLWVLQEEALEREKQKQIAKASRGRR